MIEMKFIMLGENVGDMVFHLKKAKQYLMHMVEAFKKDGEQQKNG